MVVKEVSKDEKIELLERFLRATVGTCNSKITYRKYDILQTEIEVEECDLGNVIKMMSNLELNDIWTSFYPKAREEKFDDTNIHLGYVNAEFIFEPEYWRENETLKKRIKELEEKKPTKQSLSTEELHRLDALCGGG